MFVKYDEFDGFYDFMYEQIGENIACRTVENLTCDSYYFILNKGEKDKITEIISRYVLKDYNLIEDIKNYINKLDDDDKKSIEEILEGLKCIDNYFIFNYLEQYDDDHKDLKLKKEYENLCNELFEITNKYIISSYPFSIKDFKSIRLDECISYFIVDEANADLTKNTVKQVTNKKIKLEHLDIKNEKYKINGLAYFSIYSNFILHKESIFQQELSKMLSEVGISNCVYIDEDGMIDKCLKISLKEHYVKPHFGDYKEDLGKTFKTSWDADFARILNYLDINWEYKVKKYDIGGKLYTPSFLLKNNILVDLNEYWNTDKANIKYFRARYKDYKIFTIDPDMMITLAKIFSDKISRWESKRIYIRSEIMPLVGINFLEDKTAVNELIIGDSVYLKREKNNKFDINAIQVINKHEKLLGYISAYWASIYADKIDIGMKYIAEVKNIENNLIKIKIKRSNLNEDIIYDFLKK